MRRETSPLGAVYSEAGDPAVNCCRNVAVGANEWRGTATLPVGEHVVQRVVVEFVRNIQKAYEVLPIHACDASRSSHLVTSVRSCNHILQKFYCRCLGESYRSVTPMPGWREIKALKKRSDRQEAYLLWHARKSLRQRKKSQRKRREERRLSIAAARVPSPAHVEHKGQRYLLDVPENFSLTDHYEEVCSFFQQLRHLALGRRRRLTLNFKTIKRLSPAATLILAAEVDRWRRYNGIKLRAVDVDDWDSEVRRLLQEMGFFELLNVQNPDRYVADNGTGLRLIKFMSADLAEGQLAREFRIALERVAGPNFARPLLFGGVTEAMANVIHHAYPNDGKFAAPPLRKRWWLSGSFDPSTHTITVLFFDQGVGIPSTLPRSRHWERARGFLQDRKLSGNDDAAMIKAAMEVGRSRTGDEWRGHGLQNIRQFVEDSPSGRLRIVSRHGEYLYDQGGQDAMIRHPISVGGTLIEWEVSLPA